VMRCCFQNEAHRFVELMRINSRRVISRL
jgi:hypothetical protein